MLFLMSLSTAEMEENDEDGEEDMFEDALQAAEKDDKKRSAAAKEEAAAASLEKLIGAPLGSIQPVVAAVVEAAAAAAPAVTTAVDVKPENKLSLSAVEDNGETDTAEDDLVCAMQSTSISGSSISDMPTP